MNQQTFLEKLKGHNLNDSDRRKSLWKDPDFQEELAEYAGEIIAKAVNAFWKEHRVDPINIADFWKYTENFDNFFMLNHAWHNLERFIYEDTITIENLPDGLVNAYHEFTLNETDNTNTPEPNLTATYY